MNPQDEILAAACRALDKAHDLLGFVVRHDGKCTPEFVASCAAWVDGEYDPGERRPKPCKHKWVKAALDDSIGCSRCGVRQHRAGHAVSDDEMNAEMEVVNARLAALFSQCACAETHAWNFTTRECDHCGETYPYPKDEP